MKANITKLQLISIFKGMAFYLPVVSLFFLSQGVSLPAIVISQVFYSVFILIGNVPSGILADKVGHKTSILLGHAISGTGYIVMVLLGGLPGLFAAYSLRGLGISFVSGSDEALMFESVQESDGSTTDFRKHWGSYVANDVIGFAISTLVAGIVLARLGSRSYVPLILITGLSEVAAFCIAATLKSPLKLLVSVKQKSSAILASSLSLIRNNKTVYTLLLVPILTFSGEYFLYGVYQPYFQSAGVKPLFIGAVLTIGAAINFFVLRNSHKLERYLSLEKIILIINGFMALSYAAMALFISPVFLVVSFVLLKGSFNAQVPIIADYIHEHTDSSIRATVASSISFIQQFFQIIIRIVLGILVGAIGISHTLLVQALYLLIGAMIAYFVMVACGCTHRIGRHYT